MKKKITRDKTNVSHELRKNIYILSGVKNDVPNDIPETHQKVDTLATNAYYILFNYISKYHQQMIDQRIMSDDYLQKRRSYQQTSWYPIHYYYYAFDHI